jgi:hypothetical protein
MSLVLKSDARKEGFFLNGVLLFHQYLFILFRSLKFVENIHLKALYNL